MPATQARNQAVKPRDKKVSLPWSLQIFHFHHRNCRKNKPTNFLRKYELWQLRFLGKIVNPFHNNMQVQYPLLLKFCQRKTGKVYVQQGHTLDCKWSCFGSLVFDDAGKWENTFVLFHYPLAITYFCIINCSHMQLATRQVCLDSLTYFQLLFPAPSDLYFEI